MVQFATLSSIGQITAEQATNLIAKIKAAFPEAMVEVPVGLAEVMTNDPSDHHVLAAAVTAKADIIATSNLRHFKPQDLDPWNIKAQSPDTFLTYLYDLYPDEMVQVVQRQSKALRKPPLNVAALLDLLSKQVPEFANNVLFDEYSPVVVETAKKAVSKFGSKAADGSKCLEGKRYRLWQRGGILTITAKDDRDEILRLQDREINGDLTTEDIKTFEIFDQHLEQLATAKIQ